MLRASDIVAAKIVVHLGLAPAPVVAQELVALDRSPDAKQDLAFRFEGRIAPAAAAVVRDRLARFQIIRDEASYVRTAESEGLIDRELLPRLLVELERHDPRPRIGSLLVVMGKIDDKQDRHLLRRRRRATDRDDAAIVERYRNERFAGIAKPLFKSAGLDPKDFKPSAL